MHLHHRSLIVHVAALLIWVHTSDVAGSDARCPVGFTFAYEKSLCYRKKGPEVFADFYKDCVNNRFSLELLNELNISESNAVWTEYKNAYPGGPFLDMSFNKHVSYKLDSDYKVRYQNHSLEVEEDLCLVKDPVQSYMAVRCDEKHYRYCFVEPYDWRFVSEEGCEDLEDSVAFASPIATCLTVLSGMTDKNTTGKAPVRATWNQAQHLCARKGNSSLLNRGWRYINYDRVRRSERNRIYPLGVIMTSDHSLLRYDATGDHAEIPKSDWNFYTPINGTGLLGAWNGSKWRLVDSSYIFFDVICERTIQPKHVTIHLDVDEENKLVLNASQGVSADNLYCFTDSVLKFPNRVDVNQQSETTFILTPKPEDGYYWCVHIDPITNKTTETGKTLFIREKDSLLNVYAVKLKSEKSYNEDNMESKRKKWEKHLKEYIYYTTKYVQNMGRLPDGNNTEKVLKEFKRGLDDTDAKVIRAMRVKRTYYDERTVLLHVELHPGMRAAPPGRWESVAVLHMKPVHRCGELRTDYGEAVPAMPMGEATTVGCVTYKCVGDFNEGVQWSMSAREGCVRSTTEKVLLHFKEAVTMLIPTAEPGSTVRLETQHRDHDSSEESTEKRPPKTTTTPCEDDTTETVVTASTPIDFSTISTTVEEVLTASTPMFPETTALPTVPTPLPPEDQLLQVMEDLDRLVNDTVVMENITTVFDQVNTILEVDEALEIPGRLLHLLDQLGQAVQLGGAHSAAAVASNVALLVADARRDRPVRGLRLAARSGDLFTNDSFEIMTDPANATSLDAAASEAVVQLPASVASSAHRISFVVFRNDRAFRPATLDQRFNVNSRILAINVHNLTTFPKGEVIDIHISPITSNITRNERRACAYWHFDGNDNSGHWSTAGCTFIPASNPGQLDTCRCDHLTHFAEILVPRVVFSERNENALELISVIGLCLSILGLTMVGVTAALFRTWRRDFSNKIWLQLCVSILIMSICFLIIVFARFDRYNIACMLVGILLHYSVLTSFCWMLVAAVLSYRRLVLVFTVEASHKLLRASAFSYGLPCAIVGILLSVAPRSYAGRFEEETPSGSFCYPSGLGLWLSVYAPIAVMLLANWVLFGLIVRSVFASKRIQRHGDKNEALRCASVSCLLVFLFGLPWIFGLFAFNVVAAYLFTITTTFQGFVLFIFFVLGNKKTRDLWLNKLKIKQTRKVPVTSSTYTNRSTGYRGAIPPSSIEAKESKPRSLTSSDDSKFS